MPVSDVQLKVCCIASVAEAELALAHGADAIGLVSAMPSGPGPIPDADIAVIARATAGRARRFLLTSRTTAAGIAAHVREAGTDTVQIVDTPAVEALRELRRLLEGIALVPVIHVRGPDAIAQALALAPFADVLLLDSGNPRGAVRELGGTGRTHDWEVSAALVRAVAPCPVFLAGGLRADNIAEAVRTVGPAGVDLCSGVRTGGRLDAAKLAAFVSAMRAERPR
ncbi:MAG: phosphoribosylanthranilate isomerase [Gemmatimonadaceae bacterium]|nr:phosphoribosylanthranilate isomerase [Gemmatimonadaceae bacterium]